MANYATLKAAINAVIKANGNKEITGTVLNETLTAMVNSLGANYQFAGVATPSTNPGTPDQNVFYIAGQAGTYTNFNSTVLHNGLSILKWNGSWSGETVLAGDGVFDISAYKATGGTLATFADLSAALDGGNNIPSALRKGGMSVKFIQGSAQSSDNKYVEWRLVTNIWSDDIHDWQGVDNEPTADSDNTVKSGGVAKELNKGIIYTSTTDNFLDVVNVKGDVAIIADATAGNAFATNANGAIISDFIYVGDIQGGKVTVSGYVPEYRRNIVFIKEANYDNTNVVETYHLSVDNRTVDVPFNAKYAVVCLRFDKYDTNSYKSIKLSKTENVATQQFKAYPLGFVGQEKYFNDGIQKMIKEVENDFSRKCPWYYEIFTSSTSNHLDVETVLKGYTLNNYYQFQKTGNDNDVLSRPIYVGDIVGGKMKITGYTPSWGYIISFFKSSDFNTASGVGYYFLSSADREITVPDNAVFAIIILKTPGAQYSYANEKVSKTSVATTDDFEPKYLGNAMHPELFYQKAIVGNVGKLIEKETIIKKYLPYTVGSPTTEFAESGQYERVNLLFFTDSHIAPDNIPQCLENVKETIDFEMDCPVAFDALLHGGDIINPYGIKTKAYTSELMEPFFKECKRSPYPVIFSIGNHDTNDWGNTPANAFNEEDWGNVWLDWAETNYGIVRQTKQNGKKSTWHYIDMADKKVRIICLDVQDVDKTLADNNGNVIYCGAQAFYISNEQFNWVASTALNFDDKDEKDWGVLILSHQDTRYGVNVHLVPETWVEIPDWQSGESYAVGQMVKKSGSFRCKTANSDSVWDASKWQALNVENDIQKFAAMLKAFNTQSTYQESYAFSDDSFYDLSINASWEKYANLEKKPYVICWLAGHTHSDNHFVSNDINIITTLNNSAYSADDARIYKKVDTIYQNAFDLISIDTKHRKLYMVRFGAGNSCYGVSGDRFLPEGLSF